MAVLRAFDPFLARATSSNLGSIRRLAPQLGHRPTKLRCAHNERPLFRLRCGVVLESVRATCLLHERRARFQSGRFGLRAAMRQCSGSSLNLVPKAAVPETQILQLFPRLDPIIGHSTEGSSRRKNRAGMTAVSPKTTLVKSAAFGTEGGRDIAKSW